ncbi:hypothetical protein MBLNU459_g0171t1 [Dothideomycetes sp. NU459]
MQRQLSVATHSRKWRLGPDETIDFIDTQLDGNFHQAFDNPDAVYSHTKDQYILDIKMSETTTQTQLTRKKMQAMTSSTKEMKDQITLFEKSIRIYYEKQLEQVKDARGKVQFDPQKIRRWSDVERVMEIAAAKEKSVKRGMSGGLRRVLDAFSKASPAVVSFLDCLPNDAFGGSSVLCGGLTIVFKAAERLTKTREMTYRAIESIPTVIENATKLAQVYTQKDFEAHVSRLFVAILDLLQVILEQNLGNVLGNFLKAAAQGDGYARKISERKLTMESLKKDVDERAVIYQHARVKDIDQNVMTSTETVTRLYGEYRENERVNRAAQAVTVKNSMRQGLRTEQLLRYLAQKEYEKEQRELRDRWEEQQQIEKQRVQRERKRWLLRRGLETGVESAVDDIQDVVSAGLADYTKVKKRAAYISQSEEVEAWLSSGNTEVLVINSNERAEPTSAASLFCALIVQSIDHIKPAVCLHWFCGLHPRDPLADMVRSLGVQLLEQCDASLDPPQKLFHFNLEDFWDLLKSLELLVEQQLHYSPVFLVLDGISYYDEDDGNEELVSLLQSLLDVGERSSDDFNCLKIIMTSPTSFSEGGDVVKYATATMDVPPSLRHMTNYAFDAETLTDGMAMSAHHGLREAQPWEVSDEYEDEEASDDYDRWETEGYIVK